MPSYVAQVKYNNYVVTPAVLELKVSPLIFDSSPCLNQALCVYYRPTLDHPLGLSVADLAAVVILLTAVTLLYVHRRRH